MQHSPTIKNALCQVAVARREYREFGAHVSKHLLNVKRGSWKEGRGWPGLRFRFEDIAVVNGLQREVLLADQRAENMADFTSGREPVVPQS